MSMCGVCWFDGRALTDERDDLRDRIRERDALHELAQREFAAAQSALAQSSCDYGVLAQENEALRAELKAEKQRLGNLLARIHGDGGHYQDEHGVDKATEDADAQIVRWLAQEDELEASQNDAARYRWWLANCNATVTDFVSGTYRLWVDLPTQEQAKISQAIDAAIAQPPTE